VRTTVVREWPLLNDPRRAGGRAREALLKHDLERPSSGGSLEIDLTSQSIRLGSIVLAKYEFKWSTGCGGRRSAGIMFFQSARQIGCKADIQTAIIGTLKNIYAEWEWYIHFLRTLLVAPCSRASL
jgi:hypothetical protein